MHAQPSPCRQPPALPSPPLPLLPSPPPHPPTPSHTHTLPGRTRAALEGRVLWAVANGQPKISGLDWEGGVDAPIAAPQPQRAAKAPEGVAAVLGLRHLRARGGGGGGEGGWRWG